MTLQIFIWLKNSSALESWIKAFQKSFNDIFASLQVERQTVLIHTRQNRFSQHEVQKVIKFLTSKSDNKFSIHIIVLDNYDILNITRDGSITLSPCIVDKLLLLDSISRVLGNSRLVILDAISPEGVLRQRLEQIKEEICYVSNVLRSRTTIINFYQLDGIDGRNHCVCDEERHTCDQCFPHLKSGLQRILNQVIGSNV
jgi:hypothetical protein